MNDLHLMLAAVVWNWNYGLSQHTGGARGGSNGSWWSDSNGDRLRLPRTHHVFGCDFQPILHRRGREWEEEE